MAIIAESFACTSNSKFEFFGRFDYPNAQMTPTNRPGFGCPAQGATRREHTPFLLAFAALALALGLSAPLFAQDGDARFTHIERRDGLSQNTVYSIIQDRNGFMWFGTENGLNRYDGYSFTVFNPVADDAASISHNTILMQLEDRQGVIWIGTLNGGLNRYDPHNGKFSNYRHAADRRDSLSNDIVGAIHEDREGGLWIGTEGGLNRLDRASGKFTLYPLAATAAEDASERIHDICEDPAGGLWIGRFGGGITHLDPRSGRRVHYRHDPADPTSLSSDNTQSLLLDHKGTLWVCTDDGLNRLDRDSGRFTRVPILPPGTGAGRREQVFTMAEDRSGGLWFGFAGGLAHRNARTGKMTVYRNNPLDAGSLGGDVVFSIYEDRSGILWVGTDTGGISQFNPNRKKFSHYRVVPGQRNGLGSSIVHCAWEDPDRVLWIGTRDGLDRLDRTTGSFSHFGYGAGQPGGLGQVNVRCLRGDRAGRLWLGTNGHGLQLFDRRSGKVTVFRHDPADPASISNDRVMAIAEDLDGALWLATYGGGVNRMEPNAGNGRFTRFQLDENDPGSLGDDMTRALLIDRTATLWVGTYGNGLDRFDRASGKFIHYRHNASDPASLNNDYIFCLHEDRNGVIWAGTLGGGLNRLDREKGVFRHYTVADGLASNLVLSILEDGTGNLWLTTGKGLSRFSPREKRFRNYDASDGIQGKEFFGGSAYAGPEGEFFIGGADGLNAFFPQDIVANTCVPPVHITSFKVLNKEVALAGPIWEAREIVIRPQDTLFSLEFAALDYTAPEKNRYAYKLEGLTRDWIETDARQRVASFSTLSPGKYVFRVRGTNSDGLWSDHEAALVIRVLPPWWRTGWFLSLLAIASALAAYEWNRTRIRRQARRVRTEQAMEELFDRCAVSPREREIARLLLKGRTNKEISEELFIELSTVKIHVHNVLRKLGVANRTQLLRLLQNLQVK